MERDVPAVLHDILINTRAELSLAQDVKPLAEVQDACARATEPRGFARAITGMHRTGSVAVIAEVKRKSPSAGWIRPSYEPAVNGSDTFDPVKYALQYEQAGATAISCLTDHIFFGGCLTYIQRIRDAVALPVIRKDFIVDSYQIYEARAAGADAVLLIAECLDDATMRELVQVARSVALDVLLEVHSEHNLRRALDLLEAIGDHGMLLGINNRDLSTMTTDIQNAITLSRRLPSTRGVVAESGIRTREDLELLAQAGIDAVLVGEHLMRQDSPGDALRDLLSQQFTMRDQHDASSRM